MGPGPDRQRDVRAAAPQVRVLLQRLLQKDVLPAADEQHRHLHAVQRGAVAQSLPERVVAAGVFDPGFEPRRTGAQKCARRLAERQPEGGLRYLARCQQLADAGAHADRVLLVGHQVAPTEKVVGERAGAPHRGVEIVRPHRDYRRGQLRRRVIQEGPLGESQVRQPDGGELPCEPGLFAQPHHGVGAVGGLVDHRLEHAAGPERATHALQHHVVAACRVQPGEYQRERKGAPIGPANQQGTGRGGGGRCIVIGS